MGARLRLSAAVATLAIAATGCTVPPLPGSDPGRSTTAPPPQAADFTVERIVYGQDPAQTWGDLYLPHGAASPASTPLVIFIHGGSWAQGTGAESVNYQVKSLANAGAAVWNIEYRRLGTGGGWPTTFTDVAAAVDHVADLFAKYPRLDSARTVVAGHSAGGQLAAWVAARDILERDEIGSGPRAKPTGLISINGVLDMGDSAEARRGGSMKVLGGTLDDVPDRFFTVDPFGLTGLHAPVLAVQSGRDTMVPPHQADSYVRTVNDFSPDKAALMLIPEGDHVSPMVAQWPEVSRRIVLFARDGFDAASAGLPRPS